MASKTHVSFLASTLLLIIISPLSHASSQQTSRRSLKAFKPPSSPFAFIGPLQGSRKGDNVKGIQDLKQYLEKFGYYSFSSQSASRDDIFGDALEAAVKTYQLNYNLEVTGALDAATVSKMIIPRCGVADIINGTSSMRSGKKSQHHDHGHEVAHYSFFQGSPKWPATKYHLIYAFRDGTSTQAIGAVTRAFQTWTANSKFTFSRGQSNETPDLMIGFYRRNHGDGHPFDGPGGVLAHSTAPTVGWFHYDADEKWVVGSVSNGFDLETIALHEIGHLLGLGHTSVQGAVMYPYADYGEVLRTLQPDDLAGIKALYG